MVPIRFTSLILGLLLVLNALRDSSLHAHQGYNGMNGNGLAATGENVMSIQEELLDGIPAAAMARRKGLGGRKMVVDKELRKEIEKEKGLNGRSTTSKISGKDKDASKKSLGRSQDHLNDQNNINILESKTFKSASFGISGSDPIHFPKTDLHNSQDSKAVSKVACLNCSSRSDKPVSQEPHDTVQRDEAQRLLEAANDEIVNLMHKDYKGMNTPCRKPPINNHEPSD